jgi:hypothetical protein
MASPTFGAGGVVELSADRQAQDVRAGARERDRVADAVVDAPAAGNELVREEAHADRERSRDAPAHRVEHVER